MEVELILPKKELFIGSYIKVNVVIDPASGRPIEYLEFILPDGSPVELFHFPVTQILIPTNLISCYVLDIGQERIV